MSNHERSWALMRSHEMIMYISCTPTLRSYRCHEMSWDVMRLLTSFATSSMDLLDTAAAVFLNMSKALLKRFDYKPFLIIRTNYKFHIFYISSYKQFRYQRYLHYFFSSPLEFIVFAHFLIISIIKIYQSSHKQETHFLFKCFTGTRDLSMFIF